MKYKLALVAKDIQNSVLPIAYSAYGKDLGIEVEFAIHNISHEELDDTIKYAKENLNGLTITMPYKRCVLDYADLIDTSAKKCGSSNIFLINEKGITAYNTDGWGLIKALQLKGISVKDKNIVMVGAGGVALSIAYNLSLNQVNYVNVLNIYEDETQRLCERFGKTFTPYALNDKNLVKCCKNADIFINASILGQVGYDDYGNLDFLKQLNKDAVVFDVNYSNPKAKLVEAAKDYGLRAYNGKSMSALRGIRAMEIWTGKTPSDATALELVKQLESN